MVTATKAVIRRIPLEIMPLAVVALPALIFLGAAAVADSAKANSQTLFSQDATSQVAADTDQVWWENTLLFVCPFH